MGQGKRFALFLCISFAPCLFQIFDKPFTLLFGDNSRLAESDVFIKRVITASL